MSGYQNGTPPINNPNDVDALVDSLFFGNNTLQHSNQPPPMSMNPVNISSPMTGMIQGNLKDVHNATKANQTYQNTNQNPNINQMYHMQPERTQFTVNRNVPRPQNSMMQTIPNSQMRQKHELKPIQPYPTTNQPPPQPTVMNKSMHYQGYQSPTSIQNNTQPQQQKQFQSFQMPHHNMLHIQPQPQPQLQQTQQRQMQMTRMPPKQSTIHKQQPYPGQVKLQQRPQQNVHSHQQHLHHPQQLQRSQLRSMSQIPQTMPQQIPPQQISQMPHQGITQHHHQVSHHQLNQQQLDVQRKHNEELMKKRKRQIQLIVESNKQAKILAEKDAQLALLPDFETPFRDINDICERLSPFHIIGLIKEDDDEETKSSSKDVLDERARQLISKADTLLHSFYDKIANQYEPTENGNIAREEKFLMQRLLFHEYQEIAGKGGNV